MSIGWGHARLRFERHEYFLAPIDECYKLVGLIRGHWRGLWGGSEVWLHIAEFFAGFKSMRSAGSGQQFGRQQPVAR